MTARERDRKTQRPWRIVQRCRVSPYSFFLSHTSRTTVPVMCLNLGRTYTFHCRTKRQASLEMVGPPGQCSVLVRSGNCNYFVAEPLTLLPLPAGYPSGHLPRGGDRCVGWSTFPPAAGPRVSDHCWEV